MSRLRRTLPALAALVLAAGVAVGALPDFALAFQPGRPAIHMGGGRPTGVNPVGVPRFAPRPVGRPLVIHPFPPHRFVPRPFPRRFLPFGAFGSAVAIYAPTVVESAPLYYDPPVYAPSPVVYASPAVSAVPTPPAAPPAPNVVEYPTGRYELRGDGVSTPYSWVWIPNPPPAPPGAMSAAPSAASHHELYRWTDGDGVLHITDRLSSVPTQFREQAQQGSD
jgi:hypothetical protein